MALANLCLWDNANKRWEEAPTGILTTVTHSVLTASSSSYIALAANTNRKYALVINNSTGVIYFKIGAAAVVNEGISLNPTSVNGNRYEMSPALGNLNTGAIYAIVSGSTTGVLSLTEGV
jgi:hypothetical protein